MRAYILRRLLISIPLVFLMTFVIFAVINTNPQSALDRYILNPNISFQVIEQVKEQTGFYDAMPVRYAKWLSGVLFDFRLGRRRRSLVSFADARQFSGQFKADAQTSITENPGTLSAATPTLPLLENPETAHKLSTLQSRIASYQVAFEVMALPKASDAHAPGLSASPASPSLTLRLQGPDTNQTLNVEAMLAKPGAGRLTVTAPMLKDSVMHGQPVTALTLTLEGDARVAIHSVNAGLDIYTLVQPKRRRPFLALAFPATDTALILRQPGSPHISHRLQRTDWAPRGKPIGAKDNGDAIHSDDAFRNLVLEAGNPTEAPATYELRLVSGPSDSPSTTTARFELDPMQRATRAFDLAALEAEGLQLDQVREIGLAALAPSRLTLYRVELELDEPFIAWGGIPDFGRSHDNIPVVEKLAGRIRNTVALVVFAMLITWIVALPAGVIAAVRQYGFSDRALSFLTFIGMSLPSFFLAVLVRTLLQETASPDSLLSFLPTLPNSGRTSIDFDSMTRWQQTWDLVRHAIAPTLVLALGGMAGMQRVMRGTMLETQRQPFIVTARAKGLGEFRVIGKHALRNAITPFVAGFGSILPALIGGSLFIEMVFNYPGVGQMMYPAVLNRDLNLVMANTLIAALLLVIGNLVADILLAVADPRVSYD